MRLLKAVSAPTHSARHFELFVLIASKLIRVEFPQSPYPLFPADEFAANKALNTGGTFKVRLRRHQWRFG